jgi:hypothetical protein
MTIREFLPLTLIASAVASVAFAQAPPQQNVVRRADGGTSGAMESIFIPPKAGAPFSLTLDTEWTRPMSGGGTFTVANERHIVRDSKGRIYQERWGLVPKGGKVKSVMGIFQITDPEQHTWFNCNPWTKVCDLYRYDLTTKDKFEPPIGASGPLPNGNGIRQHEDLGAASTEGIDTHGYRETTTINTGVMGNDQPMVTSREFWYSPRLAVNLVSTVDAPQSGKQVFTAREISIAEPDASFFEIPADYKIVDRLKEQN